MSNDLQATISTNLGRTVSELAKVQTSLKQLHSEVRNVNRESNAFQQSGSRAFSEAGKEVESLSGKMKEAGHGFHFFGGSVGKVGGELSKLAGFAAAAGPVGGLLAGAMMVAGFAMEEYTKTIEKNIEKLKEQVEAEAAHRDAVLKGKEAMEKTAAAGGSDEATLNKLNYLSGGKGAGRARVIADREHLDEKDVRKGLLEIYKLPKALQENMIHAVTYATEAGAGSFSELAGTGARMPMLGGINDTRKSAAMIAEKALGMPMRGDVQRFWNSRRDNLQSGSMFSTQGDLNDIANQKMRFEEGQFTGTNLAKRAAARDERNTENPMAAIVREANEPHRKNAELLQKIADHNEASRGHLSQIAVGIISVLKNSQYRTKAERAAAEAQAQFYEGMNTNMSDASIPADQQ